MFDEVSNLYQEVILDHGRSPRNFRRPEHPTWLAHGRNPMCGDVVTVFLTVGDDGRIADAAFIGKGCAISMASASLMTEVLIVRSVDEAEALFDAFRHLCIGTEASTPGLADVNADDLERLSVLGGVRQFPMRVKCATLPWHAMHAALKGDDEASSE